MTFNFKKFERHEDCLVYNLLNSDVETLRSQNWPQILTQLKFKTGAITRVVGREKINADGVRTPQVSRIWSLDPDPANFSPVVTHKDNGIIYKFDLNRNMFSRGNITEKIRMSRYELSAGLRLADLFAGIGYFTLPIIKANLQRNKLVSAYLFEWNPDAVEFLNQNLRENFKKSMKSLEIRNFTASTCTSTDDENVCENANSDPQKLPIQIFQGDNRGFTLKRLRSSCNRINLGLIPCCCGTLKTAAFLADTPCLLHVHHNIDTAGRTESSPALPELFDQNCLVKTYSDEEEAGHKLGAHLASLKSCDFKIDKVVKIKSYGPKVNHLVFDILLF